MCSILTCLGSERSCGCWMGGCWMGGDWRSCYCNSKRIRLCYDNIIKIKVINKKNLLFRHNYCRHWKVCESKFMQNALSISLCKFCLYDFVVPTHRFNLTDDEIPTKVCTKVCHLRKIKNCVLGTIYILLSKYFYSNQHYALLLYFDLTTSLTYSSLLPNSFCSGFSICCHPFYSFSQFLPRSL